MLWIANERMDFAFKLREKMRNYEEEEGGGGRDPWERIGDNYIIWSYEINGIFLKKISSLGGF